ncbi:hypothetical protein [Clostridium guangxiense]|uniref:hypothetical protein n=1 Tax=Clostridium guangxiense TaxID=1662055 RepID=UPI001E45E7E9|nr:hypothetical protein [Clostridium guangxiense]MCD2346381.1 hypothetical protein [Clostridium guangxiense]
MGYNIIDIVDKAIEILTKRIKEYEKIEKENENVPYVKVISKVVIKAAHKTMRHYEQSKEIIKNKDAEEIDVRTYDKISFLVNQFNQRIYSLEFTNAKDYFRNLLDFQRDVRTLFIDIQGRLVKSEDDVNKITYEVLANMINYKTEQIRKLEEVLKSKW